MGEMLSRYGRLTLEQKALYRERGARYRTRHREKIAARNRERYHGDIENSRTRSREYARKYRSFGGKSSPHPPGYAAEYTRRRYNEDDSFRLSRIIRAQVRSIIKYGRKPGFFIDRMGCSVETLRDHIEGKFSPGMTWDNHGSFWELDHIVPLSCFDLMNGEQLLRAAHYSNVQPLSVADHLAKLLLDQELKRTR